MYEIEPWKEEEKNEGRRGGKTGKELKKQVLSAEFKLWHNFYRQRAGPGCLRDS